MLADDFVLLEVDQILVELVVAVQRRDADLPVLRCLCHRRQRLLDLGGDCGNRPGVGARDEMLHGIRLEQQSVVVAVVDRLRPAFDDLDAALRIDVDQAFGFQLADRLAHGIKRGAQKIGELALRDELPGAELPGQQAILQLFVDIRAQLCRRHAELRKLNR